MKPMRRELICLLTVWLLGTSPTIAAVDPVPGRTHISGDLDVWQRIAFRPSAATQRAPQVKVAIETRGPSMQGLVRLPGGLASNFDTGSGLTVVDLINPGDEARGYAEIVAIEIAFTQSAPGQTFRVFAAED
ncbi:hypothetical protein ACVOMS_11035 [Bradyrhizobium guangxiense]